MTILRQAQSAMTNPPQSMEAFRDAPLSAVPQFAIMLWAKPLADIPAGWQLCDGTNGTPDLLALFVKGVATASTDPGGSGGAATHSHNNHTITGSTGGPSATKIVASGAGEIVGVNTHTHPDGTLATSAHSSESNEPAYYALAYIMKL